MTSQKQQTVKPTGTTLFVLKNWPQITVLQNLIFLLTSYLGNAWSLKSSTDSALAFELPSLLGRNSCFLGLESSPLSPSSLRRLWGCLHHLLHLSSQKSPSWWAHPWASCPKFQLPLPPPLLVYLLSFTFFFLARYLLTDHIIYFLVLLIVLPPPQSTPVEGEGFKVRDFGHFVHCLSLVPDTKHGFHERLWHVWVYRQEGRFAGRFWV